MLCMGVPCIKSALGRRLIIFLMQLLKGKMDSNPMWSFLVLSLPLDSFTRELIGYLCKAIAKLPEDRL